MARKVENLGIGATFYNNRSKCHVVGFCNTFEDKENVVACCLQILAKI